MALRTLDGVAVAGKRVLLRADLNVPVRDGKITDLTRIERLLPTIRELSAKGAHVIVCSHFDRPKGKRVPAMSLAPMAVARNSRPVQRCTAGARARIWGASCSVPAKSSTEKCSSKTSRPAHTRRTC